VRASSPLHPVAWLPEEWSAALAARGERAFRAKEVFRWIHARGVMTAADMTTLPAKLREGLSHEGLTPVGVAARVHRSLDGTRKLVVRLKDEATIETVLLPALPREAPRSAVIDACDDSEEDEDAHDDEGDPASPRVRVTQCISTQVGCAMGCVFCASGVAGLKRHLGPEEIVGQVLLARVLLDEGEDLRSVVFMGMGEPFHNYDATARALRLMIHPDGLALTPHRITVSTSGLVPELERFGKDFGGEIGLAISLHAADDEARSALMPINRKYPLRELMGALKAYPLPKRRRITIEYTLVAGKNDDVAEARKLAALLRGLAVKVNLIPMNPIEHSPLGPPELARVFTFRDELTRAGLTSFVRRQRGDDVAAACGQLALLGARPKVRGFRGEPA
jgi:23S rRNA (adenine2503-C2)-methyltransferase